MKPSRLLGIGIAMAACLGAVRPSARAVSVVDWLDRYAAGRFEEVVRELAGDHDFEDILRQLTRDGPVWIAAKGEAERARRELVAATFALEAARADQWHEWKWLQLLVDGTRAVYWKPPPRLIEWGCALFRQDETPRPIERWWQLAAIAVAQRSEDPQFLIGGTVTNAQEEIRHILHVLDRFPTERRFNLANAIAADRDWEREATAIYSNIVEDPFVGGEAAMRLGAMAMRRNRFQDANRLFDRAEALTRDTYVIYLARYFKGQMLERQGETRDAEAAYRRAVAAWPNGQSATMALASSVFRTGRRAEALQLAEAMLLVTPPAFDPWREYVHADNRFWPRLIGRLRAEIQR